MTRQLAITWNYLQENEFFITLYMYKNWNLFSSWGLCPQTPASGIYYQWKPLPKFLDPPLHLELTSTFLPKFYVSVKTRDLVYSSSRSEQGKSCFLLSRCVSVKNGWINLKHFSFYGPWDSAGNDRIKAAGTGL